MLQKIKNVILWFLPIIITAVIILIGILIWHGYRENHHGYKSTETVIKKYVSGWNSNNIHNIAMCFNKNDKSYTDLMKEIYDSFSEDIDIQAKETQIDAIKYSDTATIQAATGLSPVTDAEIATVVIPATQTINDNRYNIDYTYIFITYEYENRWFIHSFTMDHLSNKGHVDEKENPTQNVQIGNQILGTMMIPEDWQDVTIDALNNNIVDEIVYMSPEQNAKITITALNTDATIQQISEQIAATFENNAYDINTDAMIGNRKCTTVTTYNNDICTIVWICKVPLKSPYAYIIELNCRAEDAEPYCNNYIQTYNL